MFSPRISSRRDLKLDGLVLWMQSVTAFSQQPGKYLPYPLAGCTCCLELQKQACPLPGLVMQQYEPGACSAPLLCCHPVSHHQTPLEKHQQKLSRPSLGPGPQGEQPHLLAMGGAGLHHALHSSRTTRDPGRAVGCEGNVPGSADCFLHSDRVLYWKLFR